MPHMTNQESAGAVRRKYSVESRFRNISILFFLLMTIIIVLIITWIIRDITEDASRDYAKFYSVEAVSKFNAYLSRELALVEKVSCSGALINWFDDEISQEKRSVAYEEMMSYASMLYSPELYFGIHASLNEYSVQKDALYEDFKPFDVLNSAKEYDEWYFNCIASKHDYALNIDIDKVTNERRLWINHKVMSKGETLGVFCSGLQFDEVVAELFGRYDNTKVQSFVVDKDGVVQMDSALANRDELHEYEKEKQIQEVYSGPAFTAIMSTYFEGIDDYFSNDDMPKVVSLDRGEYSFVSLAPIAGTNWTVVTLFNSELLFNTSKMMPLLYIIFIMLIVYSIAITILNRRLIFIPFNKLICSLNKVGMNAEEKIFGLDLHNEFGEVSQTIQTMRERLAVYNEELINTIHAAEKASQAKGNFLSNMSHEMRTPLNAVIGMTVIGKTSNDIEKKDYAFKKIEDASNHLLGVINDILDMSKIEADKLELSIQDFDFDWILRKVVNFINFRVDEKRQKFNVSIDENIPHKLSGDEQRLAQVLTNLLANAVKFTPEGGSIYLKAILVEEKDGICEIRFEVTDTGIGISKEQQGRLFQSFQQADNSTSRDFGGTGLGLAISKRIVDLMGGRIWIESELNKGATFIFVIQCARSMSEQQSYQNDNMNRKDVSILVVAEDLGLHTYFKETAQELGITCDFVSNGMEAAMLLDKNIYHNIYFIDSGKPALSTIEFLREIRKRLPENPLIIMILTAEWSSVEWNVITEEAKAVGVDHFLSKPVFRSDIADCINEYREHKASLEGDIALVIPDTFPGRCALLAEDVEINREICLALLEPMELIIDCAKNGDEALRMFSENQSRYDIIFMDIQMPVMDGLEATQRIRAINTPKAKSIPIVAMTANVFREDIEKCLSAGMTDHLGKPLDMNMVLDKLRKYLVTAAG